MKICPTCRKTYADDGLNFCLEDGSVLSFASSEPAPTVMMHQPRPTDPNTIAGSEEIKTSWNPQPQYTMQPARKSSKAWIWVLAIFGGLIVLCGGGFAGLIAIGTLVETNTNKEVTDSNDTNVRPTPTPFDSRRVQTVDLSEWVKEFSVWGTTEFVGDEFRMSSKQKGYYYVLVAPDEYKTDGAATRVTLRNVDNANSSLGYGLIFHSDTTPLTKDYAFLIDTKRKKFRVVRHEPTKETTVVSWTDSSHIREGAQENVLEARDKGDSIELYINGQMATSIKNTLSPRGGVAGLYSGDAVKVGFKKLEIAR